jgi:hypothetical protein
MINVPQTELLGQICLDNFIYDLDENPMETLKTFFDYRDLQDHLRKLKQWKAVVITNDYLEINTLGNPLYDHRMLCNLLNASWLLLQNPLPENQLLALSPREQEVFLNRECLSVDFYVKHLSTSELINPFIGLKNFYERFTLQESHRTLYDWLNTGLSPNVSLANDELLISFYKNLRKLIECCWLIDKRQETIDPINKKQATGESRESMETEEEISPALLSGFKQFLTVVPAQRLNKGLRKMLIDYLFYNINGLPTDFEDTLTDFYWLTDLLDEIQGKTLDPKLCRTEHKITLWKI